MITNTALNINKKAQNTALLFYVYKAKTLDFADIICDLGLFGGWEIVKAITAEFIVYKLVVDGFGGSKRSKRFLTDIELRFQVLNNNIFRDIETKFTSEPSSYNLKELSRVLPSLPSYNKDFVARVLDNPQKYEDLYFWAMKWQMELFIRQGYTQSYNTLLEWALKGYPQKEYSTLKAKAKSIFNWYWARGFKITSSSGAYIKKHDTPLKQRELQMTRSENMKRVNTLRKAETMAKIQAMLDKNSLFGCDYYRADGSVNVSKLSRDMKMSLAYIRKVVVEMGIRNG